MRLPDFRENRELNELRKKMGADLIPWDSGKIPWKPFTKIVQLREIDIGPGKPITHNGKTVIVYIRDQYLPRRQVAENLVPESPYKFHIAGCSTLQDMQRKGKYDDRYVVTNHTHGKFEVNFLEAFGKGVIKEGIECQLHVCRNCLRALNYEGYSTASAQCRNKIRNTFDREVFFEKYGRQIGREPLHSFKTAPRNEYTDD